MKIMGLQKIKIKWYQVRVFARLFFLKNPIPMHQLTKDQLSHLVLRYRAHIPEAKFNEIPLMFLTDEQLVAIICSLLDSMQNISQSVVRQDIDNDSKFNEYKQVFH